MRGRERVVARRAAQHDDDEQELVYEEFLEAIARIEANSSNHTLGKSGLATATDDGVSCRVLCLDSENGDVAWNTEVHRQTPGAKRRPSEALRSR